MSLFRYKGSKVWTMDFVFQGQRIRESTGVRNKELARTIQRDRQTAIAQGSAGVKKVKRAQLLASVDDEYIAAEEASVRPGQKGGHAGTVRVDRFNLKHLRQVFGKKLLVNITPLDIAKYQQKRLKSGAAPKTVNLELGTFRSITTRSGHWARLVPDIRMLEVDNDIGRCLTPAEVDALLEACSSSESRLLYPIVLLQLETGSRSGTVLKLPWGDVDFKGKGLRWGKDKTRAGTNRTIPISQRAMAMLEVWAENFPHRNPSHFVFPSERYKQVKKSEPIYTTDPTKHVTSVQKSWETAKEKAAWILAGRPEERDDLPELICRFHDLRHTACTRMIQAKIPIP
jgi:integrase